MDVSANAGLARVRWPLRTSAIAGVAAVSLGAIVLAAMWLRMMPLVQPIPGLPAMLPHTAEWFILVGTSLLMLRAPHPGMLRRHVAQAFSIIVLVFAGATLAEYAFGLRLPFEHGLFGVPTNVAAATLPERSAPGTALA